MFIPPGSRNHRENGLSEDGLIDGVHRRPKMNSAACIIVARPEGFTWKVLLSVTPRLRKGVRVDDQDGASRIRDGHSLGQSLEDGRRPRLAQETESPEI